jgi:23S rRNA (cytosine1962-C5)-methyltransferase
LTLSQLPHPSDHNIAIHVTPAAERSLRSGHPWLFENSIREQSHEGQSGDVAVIFDKKRRFLAVGLYDPDSPMRVKILQHRTSATINEHFFRERLQATTAIRAHLPDTGTNGYRLVHGENDGLPGLVLDRYGDVLVIKVYSAAWFAHLRDVLAALEKVHPAKTQVLRLSRAVQSGATFGLSDGMIIRGELPESQVAFTENHLCFVADVIHGHKTGFFFDQRENRARVGKLANGKDVLDVFSYNGGFSLYAAAGGARSVISLDISAPALNASRHLFELNIENPNVAACKHRTIVADAFESLQQFADEKQQFDLVVVDPPTFANKTSQVDDALRAYRKLTELVLPVVAKGGILVMASCSSRITPDDFFATVHRSAIDCGYILHEIERTGHAVDHPLRDSFPEGRYLKCLYATIR